DDDDATTAAFEYGGDKYAVEVYPPMISSKSPAVVMLHGTDGMGGQSGPLIRRFAERGAGAGFAVFIPHYFNAADGSDTDKIRMRVCCSFTCGTAWRGYGRPYLRCRAAVGNVSLDKGEDDGVRRPLKSAYKQWDGDCCDQLVSWRS